MADEVVFRSPIVHTPSGWPGANDHVSHGGKFMCWATMTSTICPTGGRWCQCGPTTTTIDGSKPTADMIEFNDDGQIVDFKVMLRPMKGSKSWVRRWSRCLRHQSGH